MKNHANVLMTGVLAATILTVSGCGLVGSDKTSSPIDPSATGVPASDKDVANQSSADTTNEVSQTLYFADEKGYVVPVQMKLPKVDTPATEAIQYMQEGSNGESQLAHTGLHAVIPKDSKFTLDIQNGLATIDFSNNTLNNLKTAKAQEQFVDAIVWELTQFPTVKQVQITFGGYKRDVLTAEGKSIPVGAPLSRDIGINLQMSPSVTSPSDSAAVTLYFPSENQAGTFHYLVPVTRMIPKSMTDDMVKATIGQLQAGPMTSQLLSPFDSSAQVTNDSVKGDTVAVDFSNAFTSQNDTLGDLAVRSLILALTENTNTQKVQITVNGKAPNLSKSFDFTKPVVRPECINKEL
jgi:germination protein M